MNKINYNIAEEMSKILNSKKHKNIFKSAAKNEKPKKSKNSCCDCVRKCSNKCPCKSKCSKDCNSCTDNIVKLNWEVRNLTLLSHKLDKLNLSKSAILTLESIDSLIKEANNLEQPYRDDELVGVGDSEEPGFDLMNEQDSLIDSLRGFMPQHDPEPVKNDMRYRPRKQVDNRNKETVRPNRNNYVNPGIALDDTFVDKSLNNENQTIPAVENDFDDPEVTWFLDNKGRIPKPGRIDTLQKYHDEQALFVKKMEDLVRNIEDGTEKDFISKYPEFYEQYHQYAERIHKNYYKDRETLPYIGAKMMRRTIMRFAISRFAEATELPEGASKEIEDLMRELDMNGSDLDPDSGVTIEDYNDDSGEPDFDEEGELDFELKQATDKYKRLLKEAQYLNDDLDDVNKFLPDDEDDTEDDDSFEDETDEFKLNDDIDFGDDSNPFDLGGE